MNSAHVPASSRVTTILFTDIVDSTGTLNRLGDAAWKDVLAEHNEVLQFELDRYRGREIKKTGEKIAKCLEAFEKADQKLADELHKHAHEGAR